MRIVLDFDGVLHDAAHPIAGRKMGPPVEGALAAVHHLIDQGHELVIHTCRWRPEIDGPANHILQWLDYWKFPKLTVSMLKPVADLYIDDRGYHFTDWASAVSYVDGSEPAAQQPVSDRPGPGANRRDRLPRARIPRTRQVR